MQIKRLLAISFSSSLLLILLTVSRAHAQVNAISDDFFPQWSPDGSQILFVSTRTGNYDLFTMNPDGTDLLQLTDDPEWDGNASWSPDGKQIVFASVRSGQGDIYAIDADGTNLRQLTDYPNYESQPQWSPDGARILFSRRIDQENFESNFTTIVMDADGANQRDLGDLFWNASDETFTVAGVWSPDGTEIALTYYVQYGQEDSSCMNDSNLYRLDANSATIRQVIHMDGGGYFYGLNWVTENTILLNKSVDAICFTMRPSGWYELDLATRAVTERFYADAFGDVAVTRDGSSAAYLTYTSSGNQLVVTDPALFALEIMVESSISSNPFGVSWSPDGRFVAASLCTDRDADIFVVDVTESASTNITFDAAASVDTNATECGMLG